MAGKALLNPHTLLELAGVKPGMCVLDCSAGQTGHLLVPAASKVGENGKVYGVSVLVEDLDKMFGHPHYENHSHLEMVRGNYFRHEGVPLDPSTADRIFLINQLYTIENLEAFLHEMARLIKRGGELWIIDWRSSASHPVAPHADHRVDALRLERALASFGLSTKPHSVGRDHFALRVQFS